VSKERGKRASLKPALTLKRCIEILRHFETPISKIIAAIKAYAYEPNE